MLNLRFPGQQWDKETGLHYNYFRDYAPGLGRYVQSDPIGLAGGINTFGYANSNALSYSDPKGLYAGVIINVGVRVIGGRVLVGAIKVAARKYGPLGMFTACVLAGVCVFDESGEEWQDSLANDNKNPLIGKPGSEETCDNSKGNRKQTRRYGSDGLPETDVDWDHSHGGLGKPHVHDWGRPSDGSLPTNDDRSPGRRPRSGDPGIP